LLKTRFRVIIKKALNKRGIMRAHTSRSPKEIEKTFNEIRKQINKYVLSADDFRIPSRDIIESCGFEKRKSVPFGFNLQNL